MVHMNRRSFLAAIPFLPLSLKAWGGDGHRLITRLAVRTLPEDMPSFFPAALTQLEVLSIEPDEWRDKEERAISETLYPGHETDHIFKADVFKHDKLPTDRYQYFDQLHREGRDVRRIGTLPYRAMELFQRSRVSYRRWLKADDATRRFYEARIIEDAGIMNHYLADGAMPMHVSQNYNGWFEESNPNDYTRDRTAHGRFESAFVKAQITDEIVMPYVRPVKVVTDGLTEIHAHIQRSLGRLAPLYELEKIEPYSAECSRPEHIKLCAECLADGASTVRDFWYSAWRTLKP
jgi:hypothetical protein